MSTETEHLEELWREHLPAVLGYCRRRVGVGDDAYDVVAEVYLTAWRLIAVVPAGQEARWWLFAVARGALANHHRARGRRSALAERIAAEVPSEQAPEPVGAAALVHEALARLSDDDRELIMLTSWEGLRPSEVAEVIGVSATAVRVRLHRARRRLRVHLTLLGLSEAGPPTVPAQARAPLTRREPTRVAADSPKVV